MADGEDDNFSNMEEGQGSGCIKKTAVRKDQVSGEVWALNHYRCHEDSLLELPRTR